MLIIPQCFDEKKFKPFYDPPRNDPKIVLFYGNYNSAHNREAVYVIYKKVLNQVIDQYPNIKFQFIGINPPIDLKHPKIEFLGFVEKIEEYIKNSDVVISPILSKWKRIDRSICTKIIESLACGKPVITTAIGAQWLPEKFKNLRIVDINDFADAIVDELRKNNPVNISDFEVLSQKFTWAPLINELVRRIEHIM